MYDRGTTGIHTQTRRNWSAPTCYRVARCRRHFGSHSIESESHSLFIATRPRSRRYKLGPLSESQL
jgi:hypothetical protein